jgi:hypothetical protein
MLEVIWDVLINFSEDQWLPQCRAALPGVSDSVIMSLIRACLRDEVDEPWEE